MPEKTIKRKGNNDLKSMFIRSLIFSTVSYLTLFVLGCLIALAADLNNNTDYYICILCFAVASFISGFYAGLNMKNNGLLYGIFFTLPMNFIVVLISLYFNNFSVTPIILISILILLLTSGVGGIISVNRRYRRRG